MTANPFSSLGLSEPLVRALAARNYTTPTPIQQKAIPYLLDGRDLLGIAQTGTGKTAAFALPMLQLLTASNRRPRPRNPRALVLAPTRELATQIADSFDGYGRHLHQRTAVIFGGVGQFPQVQALQRGVDILVATPGRLIDLMQQRHCELNDVEILVLDEADRMLDMGFLPDVRRILSRLPSERQSLLFSATMPNDITSLAGSLLRDPMRVEVTPPAATVDRIEQRVYFVPKASKRDLLVELINDPQFVRTLVFTRTKHGADRVARHLRQADIDAHAIHGNKSQSAREKALDQFRDGSAHVLVATDIAARGIDVPDITHVVNFDLPNVPESYVHRIGRTARAGRDGIAISFCDGEEREYLRDIEKLIKKRIPVMNAGAPAPKAPRAPQRQEPAPQAVVAENPWVGAEPADTEEELVASAPQQKQRQRPDPRRAPGPYVPEPQRGPQQPQRPRHERRHHEYRGPAMPNAVDPEQRRRPAHDPHAPRPRPPQSGPSHSGPSHRGPSHRGPSHRGPSHGGPSSRGPSSRGPSSRGPSHRGPSQHRGPSHGQGGQGQGGHGGQGQGGQGQGGQGQGGGQRKPHHRRPKR